MEIRFRVISDLHVEFYEIEEIEKKLCEKLKISITSPQSTSEILLLVGDIGVIQVEGYKTRISPEYRSILKFLSKHWKHIFLIPGNHEYYGRDPQTQSLSDIDRMIEKECKKAGIHFLQRTEYVLQMSDPSGHKGLKILFVGCTLWTEISKQSYQGMNDKLRAILDRDELLEQHYEDCDFLEKWSQKDLSKYDKVVILTHHLPMRRLTHSKFLRPEYRSVMSGYSSTSSELVRIIKQFGVKTTSQTPKVLRTTSPELSKSRVLWLCGHTHEHVHKTMYGVEFYLNPFGYPKEKRVTKIQDGIVTL